jgi:glucuronoarabinoxylan endo-1,4-beta-xylanase
MSKLPFQQFGCRCDAFQEKAMKLSTTFLALLLLLLFCAPHSRAQTANVYWNRVDQVIDGFGASDAFESRPFTSAQAVLFFSPTSGVGLSLLRTKVPEDGSCSTINATCAGEVSDMQAAIANGARVWSTPWSPPATMKSNDNLVNGGSLLAGSYGPYANYLSNYVKSLNTLFGINLYALSVQNEPTASAAWDSSTWSAANLETFAGENLGPTFAADSLTPLIIAPETSAWQQLSSYSTKVMSDSAAASYIGIIATHDYNHSNGVPAYALGQFGDKHLWETEVCDHNPFDPSIASALTYAKYINDWMTIANANAWHYWWLIGLNGDNEGLIDSASGTVAKRLYSIGNYSKFVRPGFFRIDATATPQNGVSVSAYKNSATGALVIVVINQNNSNISQSFTFNGTTASSVTPWITSATLNLAQQPDASVSHDSFTYSLPALSVISFVANSKVAPPTGLAAKVQ